MTIPASQIVQVNPAVVDSGGNPLALNGLIMSQSTLLPVGGVQPFGSATAVKNFFGAASAEYVAAQKYYLGYDNSTIKPSKLWFAPYAAADRAAWLQSGSFAGFTLTELQALTGVLTVTVDGVAFTSGSINLSAAASFSAAATAITTAFTGSGKPACTWNATNSTFVLTSPTSGAASAITVCTGTLSAGMKFTLATGAILSQGLDEDTPATAMDAVKAVTQNWCLFTTMWEPLTADKTLFAEWVNAQNQRYGYVQWDTDAQAIVANSTTCFGALAKAAEYNIVASVYNTLDTAIFVLGACASIDFGRTNARITFDGKHRAGFTPTVTDEQIYLNLIANGYSCYGNFGTDNDTFNFFTDGQVSGRWLWLDTFVNQVYMNSQFQLALMTLLTSITAASYTPDGYGLIYSSMQDPIEGAVNFGAIRAGVTLSELQKAEVNFAAGRDISSILEQQGWYLQIKDPGAQVRGLRGSPIINFWYTDGGAIQKINVSSNDIL